MQEGYVEVAGVPTHIFTWGKWVEEPLGADVKEICICVTGNPGEFCAYMCLVSMKFIRNNFFVCVRPTWVLYNFCINNI